MKENDLPRCLVADDHALLVHVVFAEKDLWEGKLTDRKNMRATYHSNFMTNVSRVLLRWQSRDGWSRPRLPRALAERLLKSTV